MEPTSFLTKSERMEQTSFLGRSNLKVPRIGMGVMIWGEAKGIAKLHPSQISFGHTQGYEEEKRAIEASLAKGVNFFDTAAMYGGGASERRLGELTRDKDVLIATKFPGSFFFKTENLPKELEASLERLGRNDVDLYQHHFPTKSVSIPQLMDLLADAVEAGKVRAVGVSNYSAEQMRTAHAALAKRGLPLASNQVEYSLLNRKPEVNGVLDACLELGITLIAYQPLASGALTGKYVSGETPIGIRRFMPYFRGKNHMAISEVVNSLKAIGEHYGKSPAQVALRWLVENENVLPIPGAKNARQAASNGDVLSFSLTHEEIEILNKATLVWR